MNKNQLGCLSPLALFSAFITLIVIVIAEVLSGNSLFSAGALNAQTGQPLGGVSSHAEIAGDCGLCHTAPWESETMADRCMACHVDIKEELVTSGSIHWAIVDQNPVSQCRDCHSEHNGPFAPLTSNKIKEFPHEVVGFSLKAHKESMDGIPFNCQDCHVEKLSIFEQFTCISCHSTIASDFMINHALAFGNDCKSCHDGVDLFSGFDHSKIDFSLTGEHSELECFTCHIDARTVSDLSESPTTCKACHQKVNPHPARFGECEDCHTANGWSPAKFNHNLAKFKLEGEHAVVECKECHTEGVLKALASDCYACHNQVDEHKGEYGQDCAACHNPSDWEDATVDHELFAFKLNGAHVQVECLQCHIDGKFKGLPTDCYSCHQQIDKHNGRYGEVCSACHSTTAWLPPTFEHSRSLFPLTGRHASLACINCHADLIFKPTSSSCNSCHGEPAFHAGLFSRDCATCHTTNNWRAKYSGPHPSISGDDGGRGVNHGGGGCRSCHTVTLRQATCSQCHNGNDDDGDDGDD